jgi:hypothetical protein
MGGYHLTTAPMVPYPALFKSEKGRHADGSIFALSDGHVKFYRPQSVSPGSNAFEASAVQDSDNGLAAGTEDSTHAVTFSTN